jgi:hypothetical protein
MLNRHGVSTFAFLLLLAMPAMAADSMLVVDRGLPQNNLNDSSGTARSNVRWGWHDHGFLGDDFTVGNAGERWVIDSIRTWVVPGHAEITAARLGDFYQDVRLYLGIGATDLTPAATAALAEGSDDTASQNVVVSEATQNGTLLYEDFGTMLRIWQIDFKNLSIPVRGGSKTRFGVWGMGRAVAGSDGKTYTWFNHASNAGMSGARQDGADGVMLEFDAAGRFEGTLNGEGNGWNKPSDINVQVFAHRVGAPPSGAAKVEK